MLETATGAVRAMWSYPSYDPNLIANPDYDAAFAALTELQADPGDPLLANAYQQRYMPGSVFKVFTTSIALDDGVVTLDSFFADESQYVPPQTTDPVENYGGSTCGGDLADRVRQELQHAVRRASPSISGRSDSSPEPRDGGSASRSRSISRAPWPAPSATRRTWPRTCRSSRSAASARTRTSWCRSTWRWPPPRSPTAA